MFVPTQTISEEQAREVLIRLLDEEMKPNFPHILPQRGLLLSAMLQALIEECVMSREDYDQSVPSNMRLETDAEHEAAYLDSILAILGQIDDSSGPNDKR